MTLKEAGFHPERDWPLKESGVTYQVDLALPLGKHEWLPIVVAPADALIPANALHFTPDLDPLECAQLIRRKLNR